VHHSISQMEHQLDATLCRFYFCRVTLSLNTPDDGRLRPKHVEWPCRNKTCTVLHQVGVSFDFDNTLRSKGRFSARRLVYFFQNNRQCDVAQSNPVIAT